MTDPVEDSITEALQDGNLTIESDGDRVTRRPVKDLVQQLDIVREIKTGKARPFGVLRDTRYEG